MNQEMGKFFMVVGILIFLVGLFLSFRHLVPWLGRLPGDILIKRENFTFYFPLVTSLIISLVVTILLNIFFRK